MAFGKKVGSMKSLKNSLKRGSMGPIRYIPKNGSLTVRFLEEPENWVNYNEHYDATLRKSYPCTEDNCPGCQTEERRTSRYVCNALDVEQDKVIALQMPKDLTNTLVRKYERYDTLMDRDYTLLREGEGLDTTYDAEVEPPMARKLTKYTLLDLEKVLQDVFNSVFGDDEEEDENDDDDEPVKKPAKKAAAKKPPSAAAKKLKAKPEPEEDEDDEDDDEPKTKRKGRFAAPSRKEEPEEDDDDPEEDDDEPEEDEEDDEEEEDDSPLTEEELVGMTIGQLRTLAREYDIDPKGLSKADIIEAILEEDDSE